MSLGLTLFMFCYLPSGMNTCLYFPFVVFKLPQENLYPGSANALSLSSSLSLAIQTALRRRENLISDQLAFSPANSNLTASAVVSTLSFARPSYYKHYIVN